jgi:tetratricopeptide (TPR) repeat protein
MATISEALIQGRRYLDNGDYHRAREILRPLVAAHPDHAEALRLLGRAQQALGQFREALHWHKQALRLDEQDIEAHNGAAIAFMALDLPNEAVGHWQRALELRPDQAEIRSNLGLALARQGKLAEAIDQYRRALQYQPDSAGLHNNLGLVLARRGDQDGAMGHFREALRIRPDSAQAHYNLGNVVHRRGELDQAVMYFESALRFKPDDPETHRCLGRVLLEQGKPDRAVAILEQALRLKPNWAAGHRDLAEALLAQGQPEDALAQCDRALRLVPLDAHTHMIRGTILTEFEDPQGAAVHYELSLRLLPRTLAARGHWEALPKSQRPPDEAVAQQERAVLLREAASIHDQLGWVLEAQGEWDEALAHYEESLRLQPDGALAHLHRAGAWLRRGDFTRGWPELEWRWHYRKRAPRSFPQPVWDGSPLDGRTILLHADGDGEDTLQFVRYARLLQQRGATVLMACLKDWHLLLAGTPGIDRLVTLDDALPAFDVHAPLLSLPGRCGTSLETIPSQVPYLVADAQLVENWRHLLDFTRDLKVGVAWPAESAPNGSRRASLSLAHFLPVLELPRLRLFSLQKNLAAEQLRALQGYYPITDLGSRLDAATGLFVETAAVLANLDLVITADTFVGHLAGALGVPVWLILGCVPDWRWLLDRETSPWYPTMRLFRQTRPGHWVDLFERLATELKAQSDAKVRQHAIRFDGPALVRLLAEHHVEYVLAGGLAMAVHDPAYQTDDLDILYHRSPENLRALAAVFSSLRVSWRGAPERIPLGLPFRLDLHRLQAAEHFTLVTELGEVDVLPYMPGIGDYQRALAFSEVRTVFGWPVRVLSIEALIAIKKAVGRIKDFEHIRALEELRRRQRGSAGDVYGGERG